MSHEGPTTLYRREIDNTDEFTLFVYQSEQIFDRMLAVLDTEKSLGEQQTERCDTIKELRDMYTELKERVGKLEKKAEGKGDERCKEAAGSMRENLKEVGEMLMAEVVEVERSKMLGGRELAEMRKGLGEAVRRRG